MSRISLIAQAGALKSYFPDSEIERKGENEITWVHNITPSPLSKTYKVKLHYKRSKGKSRIRIFVISPKKLKLANGEKFLPHVYSTKKQMLCLYYPKDNEWNVSMYYVQTIVPWISEWLLHYEIWVGTGSWRGGGIEHSPESKTDNSEDEQITVNNLVSDNIQQSSS